MVQIGTKQSVEMLKSKLESFGYFAEDEVITRIYLAMRYKGKGISTVLLEGAAGSGKTSLVETLASLMHANLEIYQGVATTSEEALVFDIDIAATVAKDIPNINKKGKLIKVIESAQNGYSFLFLDEWDKTRPEMDSFLLDFLQSGRLTGTALGDFQISEFKNIMVFIAKNNERELSEPLMRRCRVINLPLPRPEMVRRIIDSTNPESCNLMKNWLLRVYAQQYKRQGLYRKVATIQEIKNALLDDDVLRDSYDDTLRKSNALTWMAQYTDDVKLTESFIDSIPFKYPPAIYKELNLPENNYIDVSVITTLLCKMISQDLLPKKGRIIVWAAMWYIAEIDNLFRLSKHMSIQEVLNKIKMDNESRTIKERLCSFFSTYPHSDYAVILEIAPDFIEANGNKRKITADLITK